jgi:type VI secretion system secreted protein VgrG
MALNLLNDANFPVKIKSAFTGDLFVESISGEERLGKPFVFHLNLLSNNDELGFDDIVGTKVTFSLEHLKGERFFSGYITEFRYAPPGDGFARYKATMCPWLWFLTQTSDCRIFQEMTVPDIIKQVFSDNGMMDHSFRLTGNYRKWNYCVQYRESDFNFVSRLMEQEGIYYFFEHKDGSHVMVITDDMSQHSPFEGYANVSFSKDPDYSETSGSLDTWTAIQTIMPSKYAIDDFNYSTPRVDLLSKFSVTKKHASPLGDPEIYDYPGEFTDGKEGRDYVEIRLQELQCQQDRRHGAGNSRGLAVGYTFTLENHFREDQNKEYLVIAMTHNFTNAAFLTDNSVGEEAYTCQVEAMEKNFPYRSARQTPKPIVQGPQTAFVVGPEGEEIHTDENGRVKVQFHWDRRGKYNAASSCWVRVSQVWAGDRWGAIHIPRIGQEVIVSFMEGDPDRPVITGRVYNAAQMPPYDLPDNKTQSGIKSRSTKDGVPDNFNEIRMEDKIGEEQLYIHAEKNQDNVVENDETTEVGHDRTESVGNNEKITIGVNRTESVGKNESISIGKNRSEDVGENETITIGADRKENVGKNESISIGDNRTIDVGKDENITIGSNQTENIGKSLKLSVGKDRNSQIAKDDVLKVGEKLAVLAGDEITLKTGSASIVMKKDGTITIKGKNIKLQGSGKIDIKASSKITMKGSKISQN